MYACICDRNSTLTNIWKNVICSLQFAQLCSHTIYTMFRNWEMSMSPGRLENFSSAQSIVGSGGIMSQIIIIIINHIFQHTGRFAELPTICWISLQQQMFATLSAKSAIICCGNTWIKAYRKTHNELQSLTEAEKKGISTLSFKATTIAIVYKIMQIKHAYIERNVFHTFKFRFAIAGERDNIEMSKQNSQTHTDTFIPTNNNRKLFGKLRKKIYTTSKLYMKNDFFLVRIQ